ncbi:MAG: plasmid pRiA4b ORF-3 family protein, partial [Candidatus Eisenbacteria bacterium]|nr:plasmid pRiA4b ORF-3 family protein [Candidatus Eisenbacteria bacterium]
MALKFDHILQFKIILQGIKPPIWRRIQIPSDYTFWDFHVAIQDAMGWQDSHLHHFHLKEPAL